MLGVTDGVGLMERQSSIENEPRTLSISQIEFARKAARYVVNTRSFEEALNIFTEGLKPVQVVRCKRMSDDSCNVEDSDNDAAAGIRDIVSAPF